MTSLREEKKRATRQAMADAAARLVLDGGAEAATVSGITATVGVSPRTFHNHFSSVADALLSFSTDVLAKFSKEVPTVFPNSSISEFLEQVTLDATENEGKELHSFTSLFTIGEALENLSHTSKERQQFQVVADQVLEAFHQRAPDKSRFEIAVILQACAGASAMSMKEIHRRSQAEESLDAHTKHEIVRTAFAAVRAID
ncbi:TetR/AcrR family transcriptional regulator [Corynebacterium aurimucosum]|uniref:TetR/AcrR family transcriptional regulator n=1 Tax=Corynebacterium aurimucosum TaxID=169292 RepID=UPI00066BEE3B|nr:TetR/AcrR family transcriptional regulator [Corynebacterium aurimucosum]